MLDLVGLVDLVCVRVCYESKSLGADQVLLAETRKRSKLVRVSARQRRNSTKSGAPVSCNMFIFRKCAVKVAFSPYVSSLSSLLIWA